MPRWEALIDGDTVSERHLRLVHSVDKPEVVEVAERIEHHANLAGLNMQPWQRHIVDEWLNAEAQSGRP